MQRQLVLMTYAVKEVPRKGGSRGSDWLTEQDLIEQDEARATEEKECWCQCLRTN